MRCLLRVRLTLSPCVHSRGSLESVDLRGNALGAGAVQEAASFLEMCDALPVVDVGVRAGAVVVARLSRCV